jgi:hypothetical protein
MIKTMGFVVLDSKGNLVEWGVEDEFMQHLKDEGFDVSKEEVLAILMKHQAQAEIVDEKGNVLRPENAIIN